MKKKLINIVTLGCSKNTVDSEHLMAQLADSGWNVVFDSNSSDAKVVVINTCGFIGDAKEESVNTILEFVRAKEAGLIEKIYVLGCLSERYKKDLEAEIPEVDGYFGARTLEDVVRELTGEFKPELQCRRIITTPSHYAYLKISEGCNWRCGYCAIPLIRGTHRSVPMEDLLEEARLLAQGGVKELIVIAQDSTYYGIDLYGERRIAQLLRELCKIEGLEWVRLHYAYPSQFPLEVLEVLRDEPKMCKYLDLPVQHISTNQLKAMRRNITREQTEELISKIRKEVPGITLRTTMIVGYPGETEADFGELVDFVTTTKFDRLGVFTYSEEEGTYSAEKLQNDVPEDEKERRRDEIMEIQSAISLAKNEEKVEKTFRVIIDRVEGDYFVGRTEGDSPEVDNEVLISSKEKLSIGEFYDVVVTQADEYDLYGKVVK